MVRVLRRLRQLRHVDVVGPLGVARVDVGTWDAVGLLQSEMLVLGPEKIVLGGRGKGREAEYIPVTGT